MNQDVLCIAEAVSTYFTGVRKDALLDLITPLQTLEQANDLLLDITGIEQFFPDIQAQNDFYKVISSPNTGGNEAKVRQWGDFQTPPGLVAKVCTYLAQANVSPEVIIEPTYGAGNFILGALEAFPTAKSVYGVEIQEKYAWHIKLALLSKALLGQRSVVKIKLVQDDIFAHDFPHSLCEYRNLLILGNPPWVTNAEIGALEAGNLPIKSNLKSLTGLDALTGKSNFDLAEYVLLRMLDIFGHHSGTVALLCKNTVIKNFVERQPQRKYAVSNIRAFPIDAARHFGAAVDASLLVMELGASQASLTCMVADIERPSYVLRQFGWTNSKFVSNIDLYEATSAFDGKSPFIWRQGIKHDCAGIMELNMQEKRLVNGEGEEVQVENECIYALLKSSDLRNVIAKTVRKQVIITHTRLGEETSTLKLMAPKLWTYLNLNTARFEKRKSSIYHGKPRFSIFGIGEYSFQPYKVAISGLYKQPVFALVLPYQGRPVMLDDTCYFLGFDNYTEALLTVMLLSSTTVTQFLQSIVFSNAKRPYTKEILMRIDLKQVASHVSFRELCDQWISKSKDANISVTEDEFQTYKQQISADARQTPKQQFTFDL